MDFSSGDYVGRSSKAKELGEDIGVINKFEVIGEVLRIVSMLPMGGMMPGIQRVLCLRLSSIESTLRYGTVHREIRIRTTSGHLYRATCENLVNMDEAFMAAFKSTMEPVYHAETIKEYQEKKRKTEQQSEAEPQPE